MISELVRIYDNPDSASKVTMYFNDKTKAGATYISGLLNNDTIAIGATATWADLNDSELSGKELGSMAGKVGELVGGTADLALRASGISTRPRICTLSYWQGTEKPSFDLDLVFIRVSDNSNEPRDNPLYNVVEITKRCFPTKSESDSGSINSMLGSAISGLAKQFGIKTEGSATDQLGFMHSPMGYTPFDAITKQISYQVGPTGNLDSMDGTCSLRIGKWFNAYNLLLVSSQFEVSKAVAPSGLPLYATGTVQFQSNGAITYDEYRNWFNYNG